MASLFESLARDAAARGGRKAVRWVLIRSALDVLWLAIRTQRISILADIVGLNVRQGFRALRRRPGFAFLACATFALGIGATVAIFGVVNAVLLRPLPYPEPDRLVRLLGTRRGVLTGEGTLSYLNAQDIGARSRALVHLSAYDEWRPNLTGDGEPELVSAGTVNVGFFRALGVTPYLGRFFEPEEDMDGQDRVVVLGYGLWQRRYGGDPTVVGETIVLNDIAHTIVGVLGPDFEDPRLSGPRWDEPELWRPLGYGGLPVEEQPARGSSSYTAIARLAPDATLEEARAELAVLSAQLERDFPDQNTGVGMTAVTLRESIVGDVRASLLMLLSAVGLLLAIASANAGSLLLGRAAERRREVAMRIALGASRVRVASQIAIETLVLAFMGGTIGVVAALSATRGLVLLGEEFVPRGTDVGIDAKVLGFALLVTVGTGLICAAGPAITARSTGLGGALREGDRGTTGARATARLRAGLIVVEVALAMLLLVGAGLLTKSLWHLMREDVGIEPAGVLTFDLAPPASSYPDAVALASFYDELLMRLRALAGVEEAATVNIAPLTGGFDGNSVARADRPPPGPGEAESAEVRTVSPEYFAAVSLPLLQGRLLDAADRAGTTPVAVVSRSLADRVWPGEPALGKHFVTVGSEVEVVGIVADVKHMRLEDAAPPTFYVARAQGIIAWQLRRTTVVLRTDGNGSALGPAARAAVHEIDTELPIANLRTMEQVIAQSAAPPRFRTLLLGSFALLALLLATLGIYGVISYAVAQRTREMAIRMALGARATTVRGLVVRQGLTPVLLGLAIGTVSAIGLSGMLAAVLFEVRTLDPAVFVAVPALMLTIALAASAAPARRATRVDPMTVLREE